MAKTDTRKRDRAAYFRDYRARKAVERPTLDSLATRVGHLETLIAALVEADGRVHLSADGLANGVVQITNPVDDRFGIPKAAPKRAAKG